MFTNAPEITTAITDFVLGVIAIACATMLCVKNRRNKNMRITIMVAMLALIAVTSIYGALIHGLTMDRKTWKIAWVPLAVLLAFIPILVIVLLAVVWKKRFSARRVSLFCASQAVFSLVVVAVVFGLTKSNFLMFISLSVSVMATAFVASLVGAIRNHSKPAVCFAVGSFVMIVASILQEVLKEKGFVFSLDGALFDYNSVYHVAMMVAVVIASWGGCIYIDDCQKN